LKILNFFLLFHRSYHTKNKTKLWKNVLKTILWKFIANLTLKLKSDAKQLVWNH